MLRLYEKKKDLKYSLGKESGELTDSCIEA